MTLIYSKLTDPSTQNTDIKYIIYLYLFFCLIEVPMYLYFRYKKYVTTGHMIGHLVRKYFLLYILMLLLGCINYFPPDRISNLFDIYIGTRGYGVYSWEDAHMIVIIKLESEILSDEPFRMLIDENNYIPRENLLKYGIKMGINPDYLLESAHKRVFSAMQRASTVSYLDSTSVKDIVPKIK